MNHKHIFFMYWASFVAMFITMYIMVAQWNHVYITINKVYMALLMVTAMAIVNPLLMSKMYQSQKIRWYTFSSGLIASFILVWAIRTQSLVGDTSFLRSMIPHHSSAILMCEQANITDAEIEKLCDEIVKTQREEIQIMKGMLSAQK